MVSIGEGGITTKQLVDAPRKAFCVFEHIYFARPDSILEGNRTQVSRRKMGEILWREAPVEADVVIAVPDSGNAAAAGYAKASGLPRDDGLIKNRYVARTFIQPGQELRKHGLRMKFNPLREVVEGKRLVVVDDSIVRGNTTRQIVSMLRDAGALEVHMRISAPPIRYPCHYGIDMSTKQEMVAHGRTVEEVATELGCDSRRLPVARGRLRGDPGRALDPLRRVLLRRVPARAHRTRPTASSRSRSSRSCAVRPACAGRRSSTAFSTCRATEGVSRSIPRNAWLVITSRHIAERAVTVALRGLWVAIPTSPKKSPGPTSATRSPSRSTLAVPRQITKNS